MFVSMVIVLHIFYSECISFCVIIFEIQLTLYQKECVSLIFPIKFLVKLTDSFIIVTVLQYVSIITKKILSYTRHSIQFRLSLIPWSYS